MKRPILVLLFSLGLASALGAGRPPTRVVRPRPVISDSGLSSRPAAATDWPSYGAYWTIVILKAEGLEMTDARWMHLHHGHHSAEESEAVTLRVEILGADAYVTLDPAASGIEVRYTVRGVPVSAWLAPPFTYTLRLDNPALDGIPDGFFDLSLEARGADRMRFKPLPAFVHVTRGRALDSFVPIITGDMKDTPLPNQFGPGIDWINRADRKFVGYPVRPDVSPWTLPPYEEDLYLELMAPHSELFDSVQMWWDDPPHPGVPFIRALPPKHGEDHRGLRVAERQDRLPFKDGARGVGWMSSYVSGQVDSRGRFAFAEAGGRVGRLEPDGEIITVAGWRTAAGKDPIWYLKPLETVRKNMELRGQWQNGQYPGESGGFRTPLDIAIDPRNEDVWYVAAYEDHCIWKVEISDARAGLARVSVFAGDPGHAAGFADGNGSAARFNGPSSLVFDPVADVLYVADQDNDAVRRISREGAVTTLFGSPGMAGRLTARGVADTFDQPSSRAASRFEVSASEAASGLRPDVYRPQCIRVQSDGRIILLELGYGAIRRMDPRTGETRTLGEVRQKHGEWDRGWAWLDVDRWGNSGPRDGIYWCKFVGETVDGEDGSHYNEVFAWLAPDGGTSRFVFGDDWEPYPDGWGRRDSTNAPHYPWLVAVDPRGALLVAGGGEHGLSRLRRRRESDPVPSEYYPRYLEGQILWASGGELPTRSSAFRFGWGAHNYLGLPDAWALTGSESDESLLNTFLAPAAIRGDAARRAQWLDFVRANIGRKP